MTDVLAKGPGRTTPDHLEPEEADGSPQGAVAGRVNRVRKPAKRSRRRRRVLRIAVFAPTDDVASALATDGSIATETHDAADFDRSAWKSESQDAVIIQRGSAAESSLVRWLRKNDPSVPLIALGSNGGRQPSARSVYAFHLDELPPPGLLPSMVRDARRHLERSRKATQVSRRLRETSHRLQVLGDIVSTANSILEPRRVLNVIMSQIQELIPSEAWSILLVDDDTGDLRFELAIGEKGADLSTTRIKMGEGVAGWVAQTGEAAVVNDVKRDPRFQHRFDALTRFETRSILCAPLKSRGRTIGVVEIMNRATGNRFTRKDMRLLLTLVEPAAIALENAILFQKTQRLAVTDDLTKLYNSRYLNSYLEEAIERARREDTRLAVVFFDLDGFKSINDRHGHLCGSRSLYEVGQIVKAAVREEDVVSRYGGDEFAVVLPDTDGEGAVAVAERIRKGMKEHVFLEEFGLAAELSASFGIGLYPDHGDGPQDVMQKADQAMYSVKEHGKDAVGLAP